MKTTAALPVVNETLDIIYERRAIRKYKKDRVSKELIEQIIDAGRMAPSAINKQPWQFYILTSRMLIHSFSSAIQKVAEKHFHMSHPTTTAHTDDFIFHGAPVVIFISAPRDNEWAALDIGMCAENMMLAAKSLGLDTCPVGLAKFVEQSDMFKKLDVPSTETVMLAVILGYGDEHAEVRERKLENAVFIS